ncbi:hypothetical protein G6F37_004111 [Rhizopus arrhizus]|nr:hypothetical protein G6F38_003544 [Rhizopus arrhizus]KAG1160303.1 hypothetical protein G6F37_004111 [Rhizopus arrhizus]
MSKWILSETQVTDIIVTSIIGNHAQGKYVSRPTEWPNLMKSDVLYFPMKTVKSNKLPPLLVEVQYTANMAFFRRLMEYSLSINKHYHALPVVLAICIHNTTSDLMELSTPSSTLPFLVPTTEKWILSTGKAVDDVMKNLAQESVYEHPAHSMILVPDDPVWKNHFTNDELNEIRSFHLTPLPNIPNDIEQYLTIYEEDWKSAKELYKFADDQKHDPVDEFHLKWIRESFMRAAELFFYDDTPTLNAYSEADLLHEVWSFVYRAFKDRQIKAALGEKSNIAVALVDDKYLDDGLMKLPKTLRDMLSLLIQKNPAQANHLKTVGFLIAGLTMELVIMDCPVSHHITRISRTPKLEFPSCISVIAVDLPPLLEITWKGKEVMKATIKTLNNRKRKAAELNATSTENMPSLSFSFVRKSSA